MKSTHLLMIPLVPLLGACSPAAQANPVDRFAGTWSGTMKFTDDPSHRADIIVSIPAGCSARGVCGDIYNKSGCQWEMTLVSIKENVLAYKFSKTLSGGDPCEAGIGTGGSLTLQADGRLVREHRTPDFTASGILEQ
jgi:hypothetical protein